MVDQAGNTVAINYYYPYGGNRGGAAFSGLSTKRFTGQYHESSLPGGEGLSYYNARWYDAQLGRFLSADTIVPGPHNPQAFSHYNTQSPTKPNLCYTKVTMRYRAIFYSPRVL